MTQSVGTGFRSALLICLLLTSLPPTLCAAEVERGYFAASYQYIRTDGFEATTGKLDVGTTDTHSLNLEFGYHFAERWAVAVGIPLIRKRYRGPVPHDPRLLDPPRDSQFIDDGRYHTDFQDWFFKLSYLAREGVLRIEPFAALGVPSNDYPFFGASAVGQNLNKLDVGAEFTYTPPISDAWYRLDLSYVFVEETLGVNIDHWRIHAEAGYFFSPRWSGRIFVLAKEGNGLNFPDNFPPPRTGERWYQHDRMVKHNYVNAGVGVGWMFDPRYRLSISALTTVHGDQVFPVDYAFTIGISRSF